jgi:hypothetical protein
MDEYEDYFRFLTQAPQDPIFNQHGKRRIDRGGGWYHDVGKPCTFLRAADDPADIFSHCGFRIVQSKINHGRGQDLGQDIASPKMRLGDETAQYVSFLDTLRRRLLNKKLT